MMRLEVRSQTEEEVVLRLEGWVDNPALVRVLCEEVEGWLEQGRRVVLELAGPAGRAAPAASVHRVADRAALRPAGAAAAGRRRALMITLQLRAQVNGRQVELKGQASLADRQVVQARERGEVQVVGSYLWLSMGEIAFIGPDGQRLKPEVLKGVRLLRVSGLECTLSPLPEA